MARAIEVREFGGPEVLTPRDVPEPAAGPGQVVIAAGAADVLHIDTLIRSGRATQWFPIQPPYVPGNGVAGTVTSVGPGADPGLVGRRVVAHTGAEGGSGGYAERAVVPAGQVVPVPDGVGVSEAAAVLNDGATALGLLAGTEVRAGDRVLILGAAGGLGLLLAQLARARGAHVVAALRVAGCAHGHRKAEQARVAGAGDVVDYSAPGWAAQVLTATGGHGPSVVFDGVGGSLGAEAFGIAAAGGRFSAHGAASGGFAPAGREEAGRRGITVRGIEQVQFGPGEHQRYAGRALAEVAAGLMRPVIGQIYPLERAADAHRGLEGRSAVGKTLLVVSGEAA